MRKKALCIAACLITGSAWAAEPTKLRILGRWNRPVGGASERMCTYSPAELPGGTFEGQIAYIADASAAGRAPLYRRYWGASGDHLETLVSTEGDPSYVTEGTQGYVWQSQQPGTALLNRWYRSSPYDHATHNANEANPAGYSFHHSLGWAFPRYGLTTQAFLPLSAGSVTIKSNWIAGGVVWEWTEGGYQYLNDADYGRSLQAALWFDNNFNINPTEAGDRYAGVSQPRGVGWWHGSPLITAYNANSTQVTSAVPLQWDPDYYGGNSDYPYAWLGYKLGKEITLNFNNMPRVARYITTVTLGEAQNDVVMQAPTLFGVAELNRYFAYDLSTDTATEVFMTECVNKPAPDGMRLVFPPCPPSDPGPAGTVCWTNAGAAILANADLSRAIGLYGRHPSVGGSVNFFSLTDHSNVGSPNPPDCGPGTGQYGWQFSQVDAVHGYEDMPAGDSTYTTYIASGSLTQVKNDFKTLYQNGY